MDDLRELPEDDSLTDQIVDKTPWWFLSAFCHAILFALSALVIVIAGSEKEIPLFAFAPPTRIPPPFVLDPPKEFNPTEMPVPTKTNFEDEIFKHNAEEAENEEFAESDLKSDPGDPRFNSLTDLDDNDIVDGVDLALFAADYGDSCPQN